jgi:4-amino-4-deoxy-L-arabinose transferase-like glycosyltransferase
MSSSESPTRPLSGEHRSASRVRFALQKLTIATALLVCALLWLKVPAADFDEALYAEMAKVMHRTGEYIQPVWDNRAMYDKPPLFIWTLLPFAESYDPGSGWPGLMRLGNIFASFAVAGAAAMLLRSNMRQSRPSSSHDSQFSTATLQSASTGVLFLLYFSALLPFLGMGLLLIDLLLCLFLFPVFAILDAGFRRQLANPLHREIPSSAFLTVGESLIVGGLITGAAATKGLIGWIIPGLAALSMSIWTKQSLTVWQAIVLALRRFWLVFLVSVAGTAAFYGFIWNSGHAEFVRSFFIDHHFGRGSSAMEGHSGSVLYHVFVVWVGGGWMSAALLAGIRHRIQGNPTRSTQRSGDFALWWFFITIGFFSLIATKLPNYTWPVWMALPIVVVRLFDGAQLPRDEGAQSRMRQAAQKVADWATRLLAALYVLVGCGIALLPVGMWLLNHEANGLFGQLQKLVDQRVIAIIRGNSFSLFETASCCVVSLCFFALSVLILRVGKATTRAVIFQQAPVVVLIQAVLMIFLITGVLPLGQRAYLDPILRAAERAGMDFPETDVLTFGIKSPSFSSAYQGNGRVTQVSWDSDFDDSLSTETLLVLPSWADRNCGQRSAKQIETIGFLVLCFRSGQLSP